MFVEIAIDTPLRRTFDYRCGIEVASSLQPGMRVRVPFGRRRQIGIALKIKSSTDVPTGKLKSIIEVLDDEPVFSSALLEFLRWSADYYRHAIGEVLAAALPPALRSGAPLTEQVEQWRLTPIGELNWLSLPQRSTRLRAMAAALARQADVEELASLPDWRSTLRELERREWAAREMHVSDRTSKPEGRFILLSELNLSDAQQIAVEKILDAQKGFRSFLLHGVTGSGKTEVYLRVIEAIVIAGRQALVLVPEIALTPQLISRFQARFDVPLAVLHSSRSDNERLQAWRDARSGVAPIVIGTRSAIFAPLKSLGLIIVDEEHDPSYKQQEGFRYSARDLALVRAQRSNIPIVLGSATPSLESLARTRKQPDDLISLPQRAGAARSPQVKLIDLRQHAQTHGIATPTMLAIEQHLASDGQVLLYLNRRGFAPVLFCAACGWSALCNRCDTRMTVHRDAHKLSCHHCGNETAVIEACPNCAAPTKPVGQGTERIETTIAKFFPNAPIARIDRDSVRRKGELEAALDRIQSGAARILIGTQMLAKGHHFPQVTLVAILNADQGLFGSDFRAAERLAQSIVQVSGRAGRAERSGEVLIQTEFPEHPLLTTLLRGGYLAFAEKALAEREHANWPPFARLALLRAEATSMQRALDFLSAARDAAVALQTSRLRILGPATAPMPRRAGKYRAQLLLEAPNHSTLQSSLARWLPKIETLPQAKRARWSLDVDPAELF